jgi:hypothetical protein
MLVDHVHLNEEGYRVWDAVLFPYVAKYRKAKYRKARRWKARRWKARRWKARRWKARRWKAKILRSSSQQTVEKEKRKVIAKTNDKGYEQEWPALGS